MDGPTMEFPIMDAPIREVRTRRLRQDPNHPKLFLYTNKEAWAWQHANNPRFLEWIEMGIPTMKILNNEDN